MKRKLSVLFATLGAMLIGYQGFTNSSGSPQGRSGSPASNSNTCATSGCHSGGPAASNQSISISSNIPASGYQANTTYTVTVTANNGTTMGSTVGFNASVEDASGHVGTLSNAGTGAQLSGSNFVTHTFSGITASMGTKTWTFDWNPGSNPSANATVYVAANFANGNGGTSGDVIISNSQSYSLMQAVVASPCSAPYFSEYIEGSSNNKGFEIYNPTGAPLDLGPYKVMVSGNGGSFTNEFNLMGMLASGDVYTITTDQADPAMLAVADTSLSFPSVAHFNGDDALFLLDTVSGDTLDIIGVVGVDPGTNWPVGSGSTLNHTLIRDTAISMGEKDWSIASGQWDVQPNNTFTFLGAHTSACVVAPCSAPFFSEYIEGSSNNKGFEVYNPTAGPLDLGPYKVMVSGNGGSFTNEFNLMGTLASGDVYTITTDQADPTMLAVADTSLSFPSVAHFNGDDAVFLMDTVTGDTLDIIGVVGVDPGTNWPVGTGSTLNHTLVRMASIDKGQKDWSVGATEWVVNPSNTFSFLGSHTGNCVNTAPSTPTIEFRMALYSALENAGTVEITLDITPTSTSNDTVVLSFTPGPGLLPTDGTISPAFDPLTGLLSLPIPAGSDSITLTATITDDQLVEGLEYGDMDILSTSAGLAIGNTTSARFEIIDNDIPTYTIGQVRGVDADFIPDSLGVQCKLVGTVFTDDFDGNGGYSFYMYDATGAINVFDFVDEPGGYQVQRGDSIRAIGSIAFFNGLTEIQVDSITLIQSGVSLRQPNVVSELNEGTESDYIRVNGYYLVDPSTWPVFAGSSVNMEITNGQDTLVMRIDSDTDIDGTQPPTGYFDVVGAGGQFDSSVPHDEGYQIFPRDSMDIIPVSLPELYISEVMPSSNLSAPVDGDWFEVRNAGMNPVNISGYSWDDNSRGAGTHTVTTMMIPAGGSALFVDVADADVSAWEAEWKQAGQGLIILNRDSEFNGFSGLSGTEDEVNLYDDEGRLISFVAYGSGDVNAGFSLEFDMNGSLVGSSVDGTNGAYSSVGGDVGSPGDQAPISLDEILANKLSLYPNPSAGQFTISSGSTEEKTIEIMDLNGALIYSVTSTDADLKVDISNFAAGVYLVKVSTEDQEAIRKMVLR
ncbi:MAG: lamin tail domain-containing protein [Croceimicrobium sp.]|nr:lamin tail domain-containing protein [Bacteroidota bacterium]